MSALSFFSSFPWLSVNESTWGLLCYTQAALHAVFLNRMKMFEKQLQNGMSLSICLKPGSSLTTWPLTQRSWLYSSKISHALYVPINESRAVQGVSASKIIQPRVTLNQGAIGCYWLGKNLWKHTCFARAIWPDIAILSKHRLLSTNHDLTAVESLEASVISRLPLSPSRAGTRMNTSFTSIKTVQCCKDQSGKSLTWH